MEFCVIGLSNNADFVLTDEVANLLQTHLVFSGGKRHYELVQNYLPRNHQWIEIKGDIPELIEQYKQHGQKIIVFASGDPLFYGMGATLLKHFPDADLKVIPALSSLQLLCAKTNTPYHNIRYASVHGRSWNELDEALISEAFLIGVLTDTEKNPAAIAKRLMEYGFMEYTMVVGEALESTTEQIRTLTLEEASALKFQSLNCIVLKKTGSSKKTFGIADEDFEGLENRPNMITKRPVRLMSLSQLDLGHRKTFWDIGFCTAAIAIESKKQFPHLHVVAFEKRKECDALFEKNTRRHRAPGIQKMMGDFFEVDLELLEAPDAIFIGGHGNRLSELICELDKHLLPKGRMVLNAVKSESQKEFEVTLLHLNYNMLKPITITVDAFNPITILTAEKN